MYRRAALPKATIKKVMGTITGTVPGHNVVIAMAGIAKVFAGEVVEEALKNLDEAGEAGQPLRCVVLEGSAPHTVSRQAQAPAGGAQEDEGPWSLGPQGKEVVPVQLTPSCMVFPNKYYSICEICLYS
jgi:hypothetical protein